MVRPVEHTMKATINDALADGAALLTGADAGDAQLALPALHFATGLATTPSVLPRRCWGLVPHLVVQPGTCAVVHLPGGERQVYEPGTYWLWHVGAGAIMVQWVDMRRQQVPVRPVDGWSADKWRVRFWLVVDVDVADPVHIAAHREPLSTLVAATRTGILRYIEQHTHAELTGGDTEHAGLDAPAHAVVARLAADPSLHGLHIVNVRVLNRQGDERQIEAATAATVAAAQITENMRVATAQHTAHLQALDAQATVDAREHTLRMAATAASTREHLLTKQAEVQQAALAARLDVVLAQIRAQTAEIARDEQLWQAEQARLQAEWARLEQQQLEAHHTDQQVRVLDVQHDLVRTGADTKLALEDRRNTHALALAEVQQHLEAERTAQAYTMMERRAQHDHTLLELHLRHEQLVAEQMQRLEQWRADHQDAEVLQQRQHDRQLAVIGGTAQIAAAAASHTPALPHDGDRHEVAEAGLRTLQSLAE